MRKLVFFAWAVWSSTNQCLVAQTVVRTIDGSSWFSLVGGMTTDHEGNVYLTDPTNNRVLMFDESGNCNVQWGAAGDTTRRLYYPGGIARDSKGNTYVVNQNTNSIQKIAADGTYLIKWGNKAGGAGDGQFNKPGAIAIDKDDNLYVADRKNYRIQKFKTDGSFILKWGSYGNGNGQFAYQDDYTLGISGIAVDATGNVYVMDKDNYRIQKFNSTGTFLAAWGSSGSANGQFNSYAAGIAVDGEGSVYALDYGRVQKFKGDGTFLRTIGSKGTGVGQFTIPSTVTIDSIGQVYISDEHPRVQVFASTMTVTAIEQSELQSNQIDIFPNPSDDKCFLYIRQATASVKVSLYTAQGFLVYENANVPSETKVELPALVPGVYLLKTSSATNETTQKVIRY